jgi:DNA-binding MarR family transcriptional regulator
MTELAKHVAVLLYLFDHPAPTLREIAHEVHVTERDAYSIVRRLENEQCIRKVKAGRTTRYEIKPPRGPHEPA